jgi:hypothetical protein
MVIGCADGQRYSRSREQSGGPGIDRIDLISAPENPIRCADRRPLAPCHLWGARTMKAAKFTGMHSDVIGRERRYATPKSNRRQAERDIQIGSGFQ